MVRRQKGGFKMKVNYILSRLFAARNQCDQKRGTKDWENQHQLTQLVTLKGVLNLLTPKG